FPPVIKRRAGGLMRIVALIAAGAVLACSVGAKAQQPQQISSFDRDRARSMLDTISTDIRKHYYDPKFHGIDWDTKVSETKQRIDKAQGLNMAFSSIAGALDSLDDSHTFFLPPSRPYKHDFGLQLEMVGDR